MWLFIHHTPHKLHTQTLTRRTSRIIIIIMIWPNCGATAHRAYSIVAVQYVVHIQYLVNGRWNISSYGGIVWSGTNPTCIYWSEKPSGSLLFGTSVCHLRTLYSRYGVGHRRLCGVLHLSASIYYTYIYIERSHRRSSCVPKIVIIFEQTWT